MNSKTFRYWPKDKPIPDGWVKTGRMEESHHGEWSIIIMQTEDRYGWDGDTSKKPVVTVEDV